MTGKFMVRYLNPWKFRRLERQQRVEALRQRDGDNCRRCRRPMYFDLPAGHDQAPSVQAILSDAAGSLDNLCLCHVRCNADAGDATPVVLERVRSRTTVEIKRPRRKRAA